MSTPPEYEPIRAVIASVEAPQSLRERIERDRERHHVRGLVVKRLKVSGALAGVAAVLGVVVALMAPSGHAGPTAERLASLAGLRATAPAPAVDRSDPSLLRARVDDVSFPRWSDRFSWKAAGARSDTVGGRRATTVFYTDPQGVRLGYTILAGHAVAWSAGSRRVVSNGVEVHVRRSGGRVVAEWREHGHTCVISAPDSVPESRMIHLAAHDYA